MEFDGDPVKAAANPKKHGVDFAEAVTMLTFSQGVRGKHHKAYPAGTDIMLLAPDIHVGPTLTCAKAFPFAERDDGKQV